jgi:Mg2+/Co2+ transporter CorB
MGQLRELWDPMNYLTIIYVLLILIGLVWVVFRVRAFLRSQKERDAMWDRMMTEEELRTLYQNATKSVPERNEESAMRAKEPGTNS